MMCDCYELKCEFCDTMISVHVADFCVGRHTVHGCCPACLKKLACGVLNEHDQGSVCGGAFPCAVEASSQITVAASNKRSRKAVGRKGQLVLLWSSDMTAYGIHLN